MPWSIVFLNFSPWIIDFQPFICLKYKVVVRYTYVIRLIDKNEDNILTGTNKTRKNEIKMGTREGFMSNNALIFLLLKI